MADVADGRFWADAGAGASFHCAGERNGPRLWPEALYGGDAPALWRAGSPPRDPRIRRRRAIGRRLCDPRLGLAARAPQGIVLGFPPCRPLVRRADGAPRRQARHGSEAGLRSCSEPLSSHCRHRPVKPGDDGQLLCAALRTHALFVSNAILTASPASTVPISQRCTNSQVGRVPRNSAIDPAASAMAALTLTLIAVWINPSVSD